MDWDFEDTPKRPFGVKFRDGMKIDVTVKLSAFESENVAEFTGEKRGRNHWYFLLFVDQFATTRRDSFGTKTLLSFVFVPIAFPPPVKRRVTSFSNE